MPAVWHRRIRSESEMYLYIQGREIDGHEKAGERGNLENHETVSMVNVYVWHHCQITVVYRA